MDMKRVVSVALVLLPALVVSCIQIDYQTGGDDGLMPNEAKMHCAFVWPMDNTEDVVLPEEFAVVMSRKVNTRHYMWNVDKDGRFVTQADGDASQEEAAQATDKVILNGEYYAMAFNTDNDLYIYSGLDKFREDESVSMKDMYATVPKMTDDEMKTITSSKVVEYNAYAPFIRSADEPLYLGINKNADVLHTRDNVVEITPENLTVRLTFQVDIVAGSGVTIDKVGASVSGVPDRVQLMSGLVTPYETFRVYVEMRKKYSAGVIDVYEGSAGVLGIFPAERERNC